MGCKFVGWMVHLPPSRMGLTDARCAEGAADTCRFLQIKNGIPRDFLPGRVLDHMP